MHEPGMKVDINWWAVLLLLPLILLLPDAWGAYFLACAGIVLVGVVVSTIVGRRDEMTVDEAAKKRRRYWDRRGR